MKQSRCLHPEHAVPFTISAQELEMAQISIPKADTMEAKEHNLQSLAIWGILWISRVAANAAEKANMMDNTKA